MFIKINITDISTFVIPENGCNISTHIHCTLQHAVGWGLVRVYWGPGNSSEYYNVPDVLDQFKSAANFYKFKYMHKQRNTKLKALETTQI